MEQVTMKNKIKNKIRVMMLILAVVIVPLFSGCGAEPQAGYLVNLEIWGIFDDSTVYSQIINDYKMINPYVGEIKYRKFSEDTYKQELIDALASGTGPDIFLINNGWLPAFQNKVEPAPSPIVGEIDMKNNFPDIVAGDFMSEGKAYAVPLSLDSMALYYNKDMFNAAGITAPPKTWQEFDNAVAKLTVIDSVGNFKQSGAAFGTGRNINRSADIFSMLMFQAGVDLPTKKGVQVKLDEGVIGGDGNVTQAGETALGYYTKFAKLSTENNMLNPLYTWNSRNQYSIDAFAEGSAAMMFNYSWQMAAIKNMNSKLNFAVAPVPQLYPEKPVTVGNYWGFAVAKNKLTPVTRAASGQAAAPAIPNEIRTHEAWQFLRFLTLKNNKVVTLYNAVTKNKKDFPVNIDPAQEYLKKTKQPAARRDLIDLQKNDSTLSVFATGNLIAKHWYQADQASIDNILIEMIESVNRGDVSYHDALSLAKNRINYLSQGSTSR